MASGAEKISDIPTLAQKLMQEEWERIKSDAGWRIANKFKLDLIVGIKMQSFNHAPLSPTYLKHKARQGLDTRILIAKMDYLKSIRVQRKDKNTFITGVPRKAIHYSGLTYEQLAAIHEYGSPARNIPARPHWRHTIKKHIALQPKYEQEMRQRLLRNVERRLRAALSQKNQ